MNICPFIFFFLVLLNTSSILINTVFYLDVIPQSVAITRDYYRAFSFFFVFFFSQNCDCVVVESAEPMAIQSGRAKRFEAIGEETEHPPRHEAIRIRAA